jgi:hypothetical protein
VSLRRLRNSIQPQEVWRYDRLLLLRPFLDVVRSTDTSGHITCMALHSIEQVPSSSLLALLFARPPLCLSSSLLATKVF